MKAGVSFSNDKNAFKAGIDASKTAVDISGSPVLTFVFTTDEYDPTQVLDGIKSVVKNSKIAGFCCGGVITAEGVHTQGVGVCTMSGDFRAITTLCRGLSRDPWGVGFNAGKKLAESNIDTGSIVVLPDGFQANMSEMLRGLYSQMGPDYKYFGGGAGDNLKFFKTYQFTESEIASDSLVLVLIEGLEIETGIGHGWKPIGDPLTITKVKDKTVYEIDNIPAFQAYSARLGSITKEEFRYQGMVHPLGFPDISGQYIIRDPLTVNEDDSINFVTEIPSRAVGNIMGCRIDELIDTAEDAVSRAIASIPEPSFMLLFDCISRILLMKDRFKEEINALQEMVGRNVPLLGALTFGEIGSYSDVPLVHNKTTVVAVGKGK